jgi:hypothetical protein
MSWLAIASIRKAKSNAGNLCSGKRSVKCSTPSCACLGSARCTTLNAASRDSARTLPEPSTNANLLTDLPAYVEVLLLAQGIGFRIEDMPVRWINSPDSRVRILFDSMNMLIDLFRIRSLVRKTLENNPYE